MHTVNLFTSNSIVIKLKQTNKNKNNKKRIAHRLNETYI